MSTKIVRILFLINTSLVMTTNSHAQYDDVFELDSSTVTATRTEESVVSQALAINKKDKKEIQLDQVIFQKDVLNSISGVNIVPSSSGVGHFASIRTPITTQPYFLYLQDDIPVQSSGFFNHNALAYTNFESAGSTEVLKGAGTALYGSDAVAAVVNIRSKEYAEQLEITSKMNFGSDGYKHGSIESSNTISDNSAYQFNLGYTNNKGWRDHTSYNRIEIGGKYRYLFNEENSIETSFNFNKTVSEQTGSLIGKDALKDNPSDVGNIADILDIADPKRKFDFSRVSVKWDNYSIDNIDLSTIFYLRSNRNRYTATWQNNLPTNDSKTKSVGLMTKATQELDWGKNIFGIDFEHTKSTTNTLQDFDYVPSKYGKSINKGAIFDYDVDYLAISPYAQTTWNITDKLTLNAGLRYDINKFKYNNNTDVGSYGDSNYYRPDDRTDNFNHLSPKLSLSYSPVSKAEFYIRYANGFRIPSSSRLYSQQRTSSTSQYKLDPENTNTYELGYKQIFDKSSIELALYHMDIENTIASRTDTNGDRYYTNSNKSTHRGAEVSYSLKINDKLSTKLAYSYSKHNFDNDHEFKNNEMASAPNHTGNLRLFYTPTPNITIMGEAQYTGSYWMDNKNKHKYDSNIIGNIKAEYNFNKNLRIFGKINNITDKNYAEKASYSYGKEKYLPAAPRQIFLGLEYKY